MAKQDSYPIGIGADIAALETIISTGSGTANQVAEQTGTVSKTMNNSLRKLNFHGYLQREPSEIDGVNQYVYTATDAGRDFMKLYQEDPDRAISESKKESAPVVRKKKTQKVPAKRTRVLLEGLRGSIFSTIQKVGPMTMDQLRASLHFGRNSAYGPVRELIGARYLTAQDNDRGERIFSIGARGAGKGVTPAEPPTIKGVRVSKPNGVTHAPRSNGAANGVTNQRGKVTELGEVLDQIETLLSRKAELLAELSKGV